MEQELTARIAFDAIDKLWYGAIIDPIENVIVTVGVEDTREAIIRWCDATMEQWLIDGTEAPDAFDRRH